MHRTRRRIVLIDGDPLARRVIRSALEAEDDLDVAGEAGDLDGAVALVARTRPDVVVTELLGPGVEALRRLCEAAGDARVVVLSTTRSDALELRALMAGASGYLGKDADLGAVVRAVRAVDRGEAAVSRRLTSLLVDRLRTAPEPGVGLRPVRSPLTGREWEVLDLLTLGAGTREIAARLFLSEHTVHSHAKSIRRKLGVRTRAEAIEAGRRLRAG
jgi:DNA-binding NarL/FixJ family response regulator